MGEDVVEESLYMVLVYMLAIFSIFQVIIPKKVFHLVSWLELLICSSYIFFWTFDI